MTKFAYLTIDDAPSPDFLNKLNFLDAQGIRALWFCQGNYMEQRPEMVLEAIRRGHVIGNHSYSHPHFSALSLDQCYAEIRATHAILDALYQQSGVTKPHTFFRFPYGDKGDSLGDALDKPDAAGQARRDAIQVYLRKLGYAQPTFADITYNYFRNSALSQDADWFWMYDTHDWALNVSDPPHGINSVEKILARMDEAVPEAGRGLNHEGSADIVLTHDFASNYDVFVAEVERMIAKGIQFKLP